MRTLVISDLHLGQGGGISVLTRPQPLLALFDALDHHDRLVLLGDTIELQETHPDVALPIAVPVLRAIAQRLGADKQLILVPGNHDHSLVREWADAQGPALARENTVPADASPLLARLLACLTATRVEVHYPGIWLTDEVWATHGHQLNHFLRPVSSWGRHSRARAESATQTVTPATLEYVAEHPPPPHMRDGMPAERWLDRRFLTWLAPITSRMLGRQMQRHALPAFAAAARTLEVEARFVVFGHVHRRGPRDRDDLRHWSGTRAGQQLLNTGSWRYEPVVARGLGPRGQYWPGGAVTIGEDGTPHSTGLLDGLTQAELTADPADPAGVADGVQATVANGAR